MKKEKSIYLIGSLRNSKIPFIAKELRKLGYEVFDLDHMQMISGENMKKLGVATINKH
jgi:hypothetical protein